MTVTILYRPQSLPALDDLEVDAAVTSGFRVVRNRSQAMRGDLVVGRYSVRPYYRELVEDLAERGARLINSPAQHDYASDIRNWYSDLDAWTPKTWFRLDHVDEKGPFVLKGAQNSRKNQWDTHMYAADRYAAGQVHTRLSTDGLVGTQDICIRRYVPLVTYGHAIGGSPITNEWRYFVCRREILACGYYWQAFEQDVAIPPGDLEESPGARALVELVIDRVRDRCDYYCVDVGQVREDRSWIVIELGDAQECGLGGVRARHMYHRLHVVLGGHE